MPSDGNSSHGPLVQVNLKKGNNTKMGIGMKPKLAATAVHRLTLDPMGKCSNAFFSETTNMIKAKLNMNVHWMVLYKLRFFGPI
jgi:hypothetical protein